MLIPIYLHKVRAHKNIQGSEEANKLVKQRTLVGIIEITKSYENAHSSP